MQWELATSMYTNKRQFYPTISVHAAGTHCRDFCNCCRLI